MIVKVLIVAILAIAYYKKDVILQEIQEMNDEVYKCVFNVHNKKN